MDRHLGVLAPIAVPEYREHLDLGTFSGELPPGQGGTPANLLCRELLERGYRLTIYTVDATTTREVVLRGPRLCIHIVPLDRSAGRRPARDFFSRERAAMCAAIRADPPDMLHAQWTYKYALAAQQSGLPHVITSHDAPLNVLRHERTPYRVAHTLMAFRVLTRASFLVTVSPHVERHLRRFMFFRGDAEVIPNGMPTDVFAMARPPTGGSTVVFATVLNGFGRLKNSKAAMRAFAEVRRERPSDRLLMLGFGHEMNGAAHEWARQKGLDDGIEFVGPVSHRAALECLARRVDVLVHPSLEEACPMVIIEASALGIPTIGGRRSGAVPWVLDGGRAGVLTDVTSSRALSRSMLALAADSARRVEVSGRARMNAASRFDIRRVADAYLRVYARVLAERSRFTLEGRRQATEL